ncbi:MAG TPA: helix-turn-helix transcriptional regulator [Streptosporangiaceae bacterium]|jgi:hypothetical protein
MTHPRNAPAAGAGAEKAAFLRDLRALRDQAGLGPRDLAARAHFPEHTLTTAEAGPDLPTLPVLQAYVRGCGAGEAEWEDRWRRLNAADGTDGTESLPTRAPSSSRQPARVMPFPVADPNAPEQDAIGYGLARVARGLVPLSPEPGQAPPPPDLPTRTPFGGASAGNGANRPSAGFSAFSDFPASGNGSAEAGGWFDPNPKDAAPPAPPYTPPPAAPPSPPASPGAPTVQYPAAGDYQPPDYQAPERTYQSPSTYSPPPAAPSNAPSSAPSGRLPEEFRTPVPPPADLRGPAGGTPTGGATRGLDAGGFGSRFEASGPISGLTSPGAGSSAPTSNQPPASPGASGATPAPHAAPGRPRRRTSGWVIAAVIIVLIIAAVIWLVLSH